MKPCSAKTSFVAIGRPVTHRAAALHIGHMLSRVALTGTIVRLAEAHNSPFSLTTASSVILVLKETEAAKADGW